MRTCFAILLTVAALTGGLAGCQSPAARTGAAGGAVPELDTKTATAAGLSPEQVSEGRRLCVTKCARCHKFYDPAVYDEAKWGVWMRKMSRKAKLMPEEEGLLTRYLGGVRASRNRGPQNLPPSS
jgi:hypothetical protein